MKSIQRANIVVVVGGDYGLLLAARLRRMDVPQVAEVPSLEEARRICQSGGIDACIVALDDRVTDAMPVVEYDAPGRDSGVPSLMVVPAVTSDLRKVARRRGYVTVVAGQIPPRMFYRRLGAALQRRRAATRSRPRRSPRRIGVALPGLWPLDVGSPTLH